MNVISVLYVDNYKKLPRHRIGNISFEIFQMKSHVNTVQKSTTFIYEYALHIK